MEYEIRKATGTFYRFSYMVKGWDASEKNMNSIL